MRANWRGYRWLAGIAGALVLAGTAYADDDDKDLDKKGAEVEANDTGLEKNMGKLDTVVYFEFDSAALDHSAKKQLDDIAAWAGRNTVGKVVIAGHTDKIGTEEYNFELGGRRATSAKRYLISKGVKHDRITVISFGETVPASDTNSENRRVVFLAGRGEALGSISVHDKDEAVATMQDEDEESAPPAPEPIPEPTPSPAPEPYVAPAPIPTPEPEDTDTDHLITPYGMSLSVGGGVTDFIDGDTRDFTGVGGTWEARLALGTRTAIGVEAAYVGSAQDVDALGLDTDATLLGSSVEGALRVNIPVPYVQPYALAGLGWQRYDIVNADFNESSLDGTETAMAVPLGAGLGFRYQGFMLDVRGVYRPMFQDELVDIPEEIDDDEGSGPADLDTWAATAQLGWEF